MRPSTLAAISAILWTSSAFAGERTVTLQVDNMYCASCAPVVRKSLERIQGVTRVEVSQERDTATVTFEDTETDVAALVNATTNAGYPSRLAK